MTYYISSTDGNDSNSGTSKNAPFKTLSKISALAAGGHKFLLKEGDTFTDFVVYDGQDFTGKVEISTYGNGSKPLIDNYKYPLDAGWVLHSGNVWKINLTNPSNYTGFVSTTMNVGFIKVDGVIWGWKFATLGELTRQWDFYSDATYLYVYSDIKPSSISSDIAVSVDISGISVGGNTDVYDIAIKGCGRHGVTSGNALNLSFNNLHVYEIGGSYLTGSTRLGNGIQQYNGANNVKVEGCLIEHCYDVALSPQGNPGSDSLIDIVYTNNKQKFCEQLFEFWLEEPTGQIKNIRFEHNVSENAGWGWAHDMHQKLSGQLYLGVEMLVYRTYVNILDVVIKNNTFFNPRNGLYYWNATPNPAQDGSIFQSDNNKIFLKAGTKIHSGKNYTIENALDFVADFGLEKNSTWHTIPNSIDNISSLERIVISKSVAQDESIFDMSRKALSTARKLENRV